MNQLIMNEVNGMNSVVMIGICRAVDDVSITIENEDHKLFQMFFAEKDKDIRGIELNQFTKVEGYLDIREFHFPIVVVENVYQIKEQVN